MKKNLAIVLALVLVLCAAVALADVDLKNGHYEQVGNGTHNYYASKTATTWTNMACSFTTTKTKDADPVYTYIDEHSHTKAVVTYSYGKCEFCLAELVREGAPDDNKYALKNEVTTIEAHSLVRGAFIERRTAPKAICHNDVTHLSAYDVYEAVCTKCTAKVEEKVPVYTAHNFQTKNPVGYNDKGEAVYGKKGSTCKDCDYTRAYKALTTAAGQKVEAIIAAYEAAGATVEFDADQMIAVGIEEGEVAEVEGCGVATIQFSNFTPVKKNNTNQVQTDNDAFVMDRFFNDKDEYFKSEKTIIEKAAAIDGKAGVKVSGEDYDIKDIAYTGAKKNITMSTKSYEAAFVTMYVDGAAHRVYFYERHDGNGWVYAFEADMAEGTYTVGKTASVKNVKVEGEDATIDSIDTGRLARCGAGQEYAAIGSYAAGTVLNTIGTAYATEGYNTTWQWAVVDDFEFVCIGK